MDIPYLIEESHLYLIYVVYIDFAIWNSSRVLLGLKVCTFCSLEGTNAANFNQ